MLAGGASPTGRTVKNPNSMQYDRNRTTRQLCHMAEYLQSVADILAFRWRGGQRTGVRVCWMNCVNIRDRTIRP